MRTRSEWFLGDGGCGDEDGEHDADTCVCGGVGGPASAVGRRSNPKAGSLDHHSSIISADEMDFVSFVPMMSKRPVTQLFETTSGFGLPESERERNGGGPTVEDVTNLQHLTSNSFGTLSFSPGACCCVVVDNNNRAAAGVVNGGRVSRSRKARSVHGYQQLHRNHLHQRIVEQDEGDEDDEELDKMTLHNGGDRICLIADTHDAPSFNSLVTSSPHQVKNGGGGLLLGRRCVDGNNNNVPGKARTDNGGVTTKGRTTSLHDFKYDEICVANSSAGSGNQNHHSSSLIDNNVDGRKLAVENSHNNQRHHQRPRHEQSSQVRRHGRQRHLNSHLTQSHDDLTTQISRNNRNRRSTRSSASLSQSQKNGNNSSNDNKLMVLFKILDFIF